MQLYPDIGHREQTPAPTSPAPRDIPSPRRQTREHSTSLSTVPTTPRRQLRVYEDLRSSVRQPQTPKQLPEARHQSRISMAYTAPVHRFRSDRSLVQEPATTFRRPHHRREPSPLGMRTPGFEGLYGGRENNDDVALFHEASQARGTGVATPGSRENA